MQTQQREREEEFCWATISSYLYSKKYFSFNSENERIKCYNTSYMSIYKLNIYDMFKVRLSLHGHTKVLK